MLHILWLILKFILILLGSVLGLILFLLLLILFCPFGYEAYVSKETDSFKEISGGGGVSWLFHLISVKVWYESGKLDKSIILFGIPVLKVLDWLKKRKNAKTSIEEHTEQSEKEKEKQETTDVPAIEQTEMLPVSEPSEEQIVSVTTESVQEPAGQTETEIPKESETGPDTVSKEEKQKPEKRKKEKKKKEKAPKKKKEKVPKSAKKKESAPKQNKGKGFLDKIKEIPEKISNAYQHAEETKAKIGAQIEYWKEFLGHKRFKAAVKLLLRTLGRIIKHVLPNKIWGDLTLGLSDPALMGKILAALGITIPIHKNKVKVTPVFGDETIILGHIKLKGRICLIVFVASGLRVLIDRNIWYVIRRFRNRNKEE